MNQQRIEIGDEDKKNSNCLYYWIRKWGFTYFEKIDFVWNEWARPQYPIIDVISLRDVVH